MHLCSSQNMLPFHALLRGPSYHSESTILSIDISFMFHVTCLSPLYAHTV